MGTEIMRSIIAADRRWRARHVGDPTKVILDHAAYRKLLDETTDMFPGPSPMIRQVVMIHGLQVEVTDAPEWLEVV